MTRKLTKRQREVLEWMAKTCERLVRDGDRRCARFRNGARVISATWMPLRRAGLIEAEGMVNDHIYYRITDTGRNALAERGDGAEAAR